MNGRNWVETLPLKALVSRKERLEAKVLSMQKEISRIKGYIITKSINKEEKI